MAEENPTWGERRIAIIVSVTTRPNVVSDNAPRATHWNVVRSRRS